MRFAKLTVLFVLLFVCSGVWAAVPKLINFQGILKDGSGNPVTDASYSVGFKIYDAASGGNVLWAETLSVTTTGGLFTVLLGSSNPVPDSAFNDNSRWLGMTVAPDPEMTPRQQLVTVPYVYRSTLSQLAFPQAIQEYASTGTFTFTVPAGVTLIQVEVWGAGGGGGGNNTSAGGGGGAGAYSRAVFAVTPGQMYTVKVGTGGSGGAAAVAGGNGGSGSFETLSAAVLLLSGGGNGGQAGLASCPQPGGAEGAGGIADPSAMIKRDGANGEPGESSYNICNPFCFCRGGEVGGVGGIAPSGTLTPLGVKGGTGGFVREGTQITAKAGGNGYVLIQW